MQKEAPTILVIYFLSYLDRLSLNISPEMSKHMKITNYHLQAEQQTNKIKLQGWFLMSKLECGHCYVTGKGKLCFLTKVAMTHVAHSAKTH